nr:hypothetical protein BaRGS_024447 [Batillaria attramentaria]
MPRDENEKARLRQIKLMQRKERNKAAARKSNLNKKLMRDSLEQKSVELREENLQLQQDIRELHSRLRHFRKLYTGMHHVCQLSAQCTLAAAFS